jgi:voltage-gated potassium channel
LTGALREGAPRAGAAGTSLRGWTHAALTAEGGAPARSARVTMATIVLAIVASAVAAMALTVPNLDAGVEAVMSPLEFAAFVAFTAEFALRLWSAPEAMPHHAPGRARIAYLASPLGVIDLVVIASYWIDLAVGLGPDVRAATGLLPLLKLARYLPGLGLVARVFRNEAAALGAAFGTLTVLIVLTGGAMYLLEHRAQPEAFASIPKSLWWAVVTMATVGYGDVVPATLLGRLFGSVVILVGIAMVAVPAGIMATGFMEELRKQQFIVTWQAVASLPLFASLDAGRISSIARLLRPQVVPANSVIVRRGEPADAMYFILEGEVEVEVRPEPVRLGKGQYFGEIALIRETRRTATVTALNSCHLLSLHVHDFRELLEENPDLRAEIARVADERHAQRSSATPDHPPG